MEPMTGATAQHEVQAVHLVPERRKLFSPNKDR